VIVATTVARLSLLIRALVTHRQRSEGAASCLQPRDSGIGIDVNLREGVLDVTPLRTGT